MSSFNLKRWIAREAFREGRKGDPYLKIAKTLVLRQTHTAPEYDALANVLQDEWQIHQTNAPDADPIGMFTVRHGQGDDYGEMLRAGVSPKHRGKGIGQLAYKALADHYGGIASDIGTTSKSAQRVYQKLAPGSLLRDHRPDALPMTNDDEMERLFISGAPRKDKGWGIFGEDD